MPPIRIVTWNCCHRPDAASHPEVKKLQPDVLVLQEAQTGVAGAWCAVLPDRGIAVEERRGFRVEPIADLPMLAALLVRVRCEAISFPVLGVWAQKKPAYTANVERALDAALEKVRGEELVIAGDFNAMVTPRYPLESRQALALFRRLEQLGLKSVWHAARNRTHGEDEEPTYFHRRSREAPFHIDYCFVPKPWRVVSAEIGDAETWGGLSDHLPLIVDLEPGGVTAG